MAFILFAQKKIVLRVKGKTCIVSSPQSKLLCWIPTVQVVSDTDIWERELLLVKTSTSQFFHSYLSYFTHTNPTNNWLPLCCVWHAGFFRLWNRYSTSKFNPMSIKEFRIPLLSWESILCMNNAYILKFKSYDLKTVTTESHFSNSISQMSRDSTLFSHTCNCSVLMIVGLTQVIARHSYVRTLRTLAILQVGKPKKPYRQQLNAKERNLCLGKVQSSWTVQSVEILTLPIT